LFVCLFVPFLNWCVALGSIERVKPSIRLSVQFFLSLSLD